MRQPEWTNKYDSMLIALRVINQILLETKDLEETALVEASIVNKRLILNNLSERELVDYLHQASIDLQVNKGTL